MKIKVLIVDDSALIRSVMKEIINSQSDMEVVGVAPDPLVARDLIKQTNPDVLTLDVEMPKMDGLDFLEKLMRLRPMPVVMVSSLTESGLGNHPARAGTGCRGFRDQAQDVHPERHARIHGADCGKNPHCIEGKDQAAYACYRRHGSQRSSRWPPSAIRSPAAKS